MKRRTLALWLVWTLPSVICVVVTAIVYAAFRIPAPDRVGPQDRAAIVATLRAALGNQPTAPCAVHRPQTEVAVTFWVHGRSTLHVDGFGADLGAAVDDAAAAIRTNAQLRILSPEDRANGRFQVDIVIGHAPLSGGEWLFDHMAVPGIGDMLAINPGVEGVGAQLKGDHPTVLMPHELVIAKVLAMKRPAAEMPDFAMGMDVKRIGAMLAQRANSKEEPGLDRMFRFRTDAFVESADHASTLPLYRGEPPAPPISKASLRAAALAGGHYLVNHLGTNGRYAYQHDISTGTASNPLQPGDYSMPRHAGTTYFLAQLYRITKEDWLLEPIQRAFKHLSDLLAAGHCGGALPDGTKFDCVLDQGEQTAQLGSTALTVVALAEYQRATGDTKYLEEAKELSAWLLYMQRPDGSFRHLYNPKTHQPDDKAQLFYYSGEAALALARMYVITKDDRYAVATEKALDWLVDWYDFFMGGFFYGEEHWTCIASEAIWPRVKKDKYMNFCHGYGAFLRASQADPGDYPDEADYTGAYNMTPFVVPYNTPAGSRTEAMISAYLLGREHGEPDAAVRGQVKAALQYVLGQQIRPDSDFDAAGRKGMPDGDADGGLTSTPIDRSVRIDFVQHVCSAMIRASEWIDDP
ncbi:MAG TPA: hypothetical protein VGM88_00540 [Kofleriaceae bacterium]